MLIETEAKERLRGHIRRLVGEAGFEAAEDWSARSGIVDVVEPGASRSLLRVYVQVRGEEATLGIVRNDDLVVEGTPRDHDRPAREIRERTFRQCTRPRTSEAEKQRFTQTLRAELASFRRDIDREVTAERRDSLAERLQALVERNPSEAGRIIAEALGALVDADVLESLGEAVDEASPAEAPGA